MLPAWPTAWGAPPGSAVIRSSPEDFLVIEELGFEPSGSGEHAFVYLEKRGLNTMEVAGRLSALCGIPQRDIGLSGLKDRNAVTRQWFSCALAGRLEPDWSVLEQRGDLRVLEVGRHQRKLRRGVHRANRFRLVLRELRGDRHELERRLARLREGGVPNYFGEQRFGRHGSTLAQARRWVAGGRVARGQRALCLSALRSYLFNELLAARVRDGDWNRVRDGDTCMLAGSRSFFTCDHTDADIEARTARCDLHPGLPLWGRGGDATPARAAVAKIDGAKEICAFLERERLDLAWRATRVLADDFCWQFCDDDALQLDFALGAGSYATAVLGELVRYQGDKTESGIAGEQG